MLTCLILHNMRVEEYVSGWERYKADDSLLNDDDISTLGIPAIPNKHSVMINDRSAKLDDALRSKIGPDCYMIWRKKFSKRWKKLSSKNEHFRLKDAMSRHQNMG